MELAAGQVVDRYEVVRELGRGGIANVYEVRHSTLGTSHALKLLQVQGKALSSRLIAEGRVQASLRHPNAVTVTDVIEIDGHPALVMELLTEGTLGDWVEAQHPSRQARLETFIQVCAAVGAAHAQGLVHRDLKPDNVLMQEGLHGWVPKVADFGLVKAVDTAPVHDGPHTRQGVAMGTPGYMAPEQIDNAAEVDARADVYSLGALLVWLITEEPAIPGDGMLEIFANVAAGTVHNVAADDPLHPVVARAMARRPEERYPDAEALSLAVRQVMGEPLPELHPQPTPETQPRPAAPAARAPTLGWLGGGALLAGAAATALFLGLAFLVAIVFTRAASRRGSDCPHGEERRIGYLKVDERVEANLGDTYVLRSGGPVLRKPRHPDSKACRLPAGTRLLLKERPGHARTGTWLAVYTDAWE